MSVWYSKQINDKSGKRSITWNPTEALEPDAPFSIACGQCIGCRLERSRQWAIRCVHESQLWDDNCFITLTFSPEALEKRSNPYSVDVRDFQLFMKRLRKQFGSNIRFFHCGEYGEKYRRPHYHAALFNFDFADKVLFSEVNGYRLYTSEALSRLWPFGFSTVGTLTFESAAYVARYITKKLNGEKAESTLHYKVIDYDTGEIVAERVPEYTTMSRRPGIGKQWFDKFKSDVYPEDFVVINGKRMRPPKYYDKLLEKEDIFTFSDIKMERIQSAMDHIENNTYERLIAREAYQLHKFDHLPRKLESEL